MFLHTHINNTRTRFPKAAHKVSARHSMKCRTHNFPTVFHQLFPHSTDVDGFSSCSCRSHLLFHPHARHDSFASLIYLIRCFSSQKAEDEQNVLTERKSRSRRRPIGPRLSSSARFHSPNNKLRVVFVFGDDEEDDTLFNTKTKSRPVRKT